MSYSFSHLQKIIHLDEDWTNESIFEDLNKQFEIEYEQTIPFCPLYICKKNPKEMIKTYYDQYPFY